MREMLLKSRTRGFSPNSAKLHVWTTEVGTKSPGLFFLKITTPQDVTFKI